MTKFRLLCAGALAAFTLGAGTMPALAQDDEQPGVHRAGNAERAERPADGPRESPRANVNRGGIWGGGMRAPSENPVERVERREAQTPAPAAAVAPPRGGSYGADRNAGYTAPRDRSYGAGARGRDWQAGQPAPPESGGQRWGGGNAAGWNRDRGDGSARRGGWQGNRGDDDSRRAGWQRDRDGDDARRAGWQRDRRDDGRRDEWRGDGRTSSHGYRDGRRDDYRYGYNHRRWDHRGWRNDRRYDWYRYRAANRSIFNIGRYFAPFRGYSYSRINIGFRLGSPFYASRYWINDPWRYRLPAVYGPYRWVRYYDDALLVDIYSGEVVDVIRDFFW